MRPLPLAALTCVLFLQAGPTMGDCALKPTSSAFSASPPRAPADLNPSFSTSKHHDLERAPGIAGPWVPTCKSESHIPAYLSPAHAH